MEGAISPHNFRVKPWRLTNTTPTADALNTRCPPPPEAFAVTEGSDDGGKSDPVDVTNLEGTYEQTLSGEDILASGCDSPAFSSMDQELEDHITLTITDGQVEQQSTRKRRRTGARVGPGAYTVAPRPDQHRRNQRSLVSASTGSSPEPNSCSATSNSAASRARAATTSVRVDNEPLGGGRLGRRHLRDNTAGRRLTSKRGNRRSPSGPGQAARNAQPHHPRSRLTPAHNGPSRPIRSSRRGCVRGRYPASPARRLTRPRNAWSRERCGIEWSNVTPPGCPDSSQRSDGDVRRGA